MTEHEIENHAESLVARWRELQHAAKDGTWGILETMENASLTVRLAALWDQRVTPPVSAHE